MSHQPFVDSRSSPLLRGLMPGCVVGCRPSVAGLTASADGDPSRRLPARDAAADRRPTGRMNSHPASSRLLTLLLDPHPLLLLLPPLLLLLLLLMRSHLLLLSRRGRRHRHLALLLLLLLLLMR